MFGQTAWPCPRPVYSAVRRPGLRRLATSHSRWAARAQWSAISCPHLGLLDLADWSPRLTNAVCGCVISAVLVVAMLFEGWPGTILRPLPGRLIDLGLIALVASALYLGLSAFARSVSWVKASPDDWVTTAALTFLGAGIILHVAIGRRWPLNRAGDAGGDRR